MSNPVGRYRAAEGAWLLLEFCARSAELRAAGYCTGLLRPNDVKLRELRLYRETVRGPIRRIRFRVLQHLHSRRGHDQHCQTLGAPRETIASLLRSWAGEEAADLLIDAVDETVDELLNGVWAHLGRDRALTHLVGRRITVHAPADHVENDSWSRSPDCPRTRQLRGVP